MAANPRFRFLYVVWAFIEIFLFGGLLFGWGSLVFVLKEHGVYSHLCDNVNDTSPVGDATVFNATALFNQTQDGGHAKSSSCAARDKMLSLVFTIASLMNCAGSAVMGQINFKFGTRVTRLCAFFVFLTGSLLTSFTTEDRSWIIFPGMSLLSIGGISLLMTNAQFSMLFTKGSSTVIGVVCGAFDGSAGVMIVLKLLYEQGVKLQWTMLFLTGLHLLTLINTFLFLPKSFISKFRSIEVVSGTDMTTTDNATLKDAKAPVKQENVNLPPVRSCILSSMYLLHVTWFCILQLRFYYFLSSLNSWLTDLLTEKDVSYFTNVSTYTLMCGLLSTLLAGTLYDFHKRIFLGSRSRLRRELMPAVVPLALTALLGVGLSVLVLFREKNLLYLTFILVALFRSFLYGMGTSFLGAMFPSEYFGILYGLMLILGGLFSLVQYGLFSWGDAAGFTTVNYFLLSLVAMALIHPLYQWLVCRRAEFEWIRNHQDDMK